MSIQQTGEGDVNGVQSSLSVNLLAPCFLFFLYMYTLRHCSTPFSLLCCCMCCSHIPLCVSILIVSVAYVSRSAL